MKQFKYKFKPKLHHFLKSKRVTLSEYIREVIDLDMSVKYKKNKSGEELNTTISLREDQVKHLENAGKNADWNGGQYLTYILNREMLG